ncbi:hypothetical protein SYNPS1DRAFT_13919, partial [Syncephalis pseudoplumigaleata]
VIGDNIHRIESLGSLNERNMDKVCQIICKHRQLYPATLKLFLHQSRTAIHLYDCTKLDEDALKSIAHICPQIDTLSLWYCGRLSPETTLLYAERLTRLRSITLHGPFLVTDDVFATLVEALAGQLREFAVNHTNRLGGKTIAAIAEKCHHLEMLQLSGCTAVHDADIRRLADAVAHRGIATLDLSGTVGQATDDTMIAVLRALGPSLRKLNLSGGVLFTDRLLVEGMAPYCAGLCELSLADCSGFTDDGMRAMFERWSSGGEGQAGLELLDLAHCAQLTPTSLVPAIRYSGERLATLNVNGLYQVDDTVLEALAECCPQLAWLDLSWCRAVTDAHLEQLYACCPALLLVKIWGCNRITEYLIPPLKHARLVGRECDTI